MSVTTTAPVSALTVITGRKLASTRRTKKYAALTALGADDTTALRVLGFEAKPEPAPAPVDPRVAELVATGAFTTDSALAALAVIDGTASAPAPAPVAEPVAVQPVVQTAAPLPHVTVPAALPTPVAQPEQPVSLGASLMAQAAALKAATRTPQVPTAPVAPQRSIGELLVEQAGLTYTKGRVYLSADMIEAAVRVRKTGSPEIIQSARAARTSAVLISRTDTGEVAVQNLSTPKDAA